MDKKLVAAKCDMSYKVVMSDKQRTRLSVDLTPYQDVLRMLARAGKDGINPTFVTINALREFLTKRGYARKKDSTSKLS